MASQSDSLDDPRPVQAAPTDSEPLSASDWWRLEQEMSFSRDATHLTLHNRMACSNTVNNKREVSKKKSFFSKNNLRIFSFINKDL